MILIDWIFLFSVCSAFAEAGVAILPSWVYYIGILFMLLGIAIRQWAIAVLDRFFYGTTGVQKEQKVEMSFSS